jgi:hypothetical protein
MLPRNARRSKKVLRLAASVQQGRGRAASVTTLHQGLYPALRWPGGRWMAGWLTHRLHDEPAAGSTVSSHRRGMAVSGRVLMLDGYSLL